MNYRHTSYDRLPDENYQPRHGRRGNEHHWWPDSGFIPVNPKAVGLDRHKQRKDPAPFRMKERERFMTQSRFMPGQWVFNKFTGTIGELGMRIDQAGQCREWTVFEVKPGEKRSVSYQNIRLGSMIRSAFDKAEFSWEEWEFIPYHPHAYVEIGLQRGWARTVEGNFQ